MNEVDGTQEAYTFNSLAVIRELDPELLERPETKELVDLGIEFGREVTEKYGTPAEPRWATGTFEEGVLMAYHNGGEDGHTSLGARGAGVPRNVLLIAKAVNDAAGYEVFDPTMRAIAFAAAMAHDSTQLCGRSLTQDGNIDDQHGDERLSGLDIQSRYIERGGHPSIGAALNLGVLATAYDPETSTQNVDYSIASRDLILLQELIAAADLLSPSTPRGALSSIEYTVESLCLWQNDRVLQQRMAEELDYMPLHMTKMEYIMIFIAEDPILRNAFTEAIGGEGQFFATALQYSDHAIREACGKSIDDLFPLRQDNADLLEHYALRLRAGDSPLAIWRAAKARIEQN